MHEAWYSHCARSSRRRRNRISQTKCFRILNEVDVTLIRCNAGEIAAIAGVQWAAKGVDAGEGDADIETIAKQVAQQYNCLVAVSGTVDIVTDGHKIPSHYRRTSTNDTCHRRWLSTK